jgi:anti-sigma B factor antagonist
MRSEVRVTSDTTVVTLHGDLDMVTVEPLRDVLDQAAAGPTPRVVVDLADVPFIDVVSLSAILATADSLRDDARQLLVSGASVSVRRLCALLNADDVLAPPIPLPRLSPTANF